MFQFTTTTVINSLEDYTTGLPLFSVGEKKVDGKVVKTFNVKRVNNFAAPYVKAIYKSEYLAPQNEELHMDVSKAFEGAKKGDTFRLNIYIRLAQSYQPSFYATDMPFKGKPFTIEFTYTGDVAATLKKLQQIAKKYEILVYEKPVLKLKADGTALVLKTLDQYQRIYQFNIDKFIPEAHANLGDYETMLSLEDCDGQGTPITVVNSAEDASGDSYLIRGIEGFGTYDYILHNLRLPTDYRSNFFATNRDETPIPGAQYNEYVIHYCKNRGILGNNAVGDLVTSMTTHVFYVNKALLEKTPDSSKVDREEWGSGVNVTYSTWETALETLANSAGIKIEKVAPKYLDKNKGQSGEISVP